MTEDKQAVPKPVSSILQTKSVKEAKQSRTIWTASRSPASLAAVMSVPKVAMLGRTPRCTIAWYTWTSGEQMHVDALVVIATLVQCTAAEAAD